METYINGVLKGLESFEAGDDVFAIPVNGSIKEIDREKSFLSTWNINTIRRNHGRS
jgi:hypothetical protein